MRAKTLKRESLRRSKKKKKKMHRRSYEYHSHSSSYECHNTTTYYGHSDEHQLQNITLMQRMLPMMPTHYFQTFHEVPDNNFARLAEDKDHRVKNNISTTNRSKKKSQSHANNHQVPEMHRRVRFVEHEKKMNEDRSIDMEADRFIQNKRNNFELC